MMLTMGAGYKRPGRAVILPRFFVSSVNVDTSRLKNFIRIVLPTPNIFLGLSSFKNYVVFICVRMVVLKMNHDILLFYCLTQHETESSTQTYNTKHGDKNNYLSVIFTHLLKKLKLCHWCSRSILHYLYNLQGLFLSHSRRHCSWTLAQPWNALMPLTLPLGNTP